MIVILDTQEIGRAIGEYIAQKYGVKAGSFSVTLSYDPARPPADVFAATVKLSENDAAKVEITEKT